MTNSVPAPHSTPQTPAWAVRTGDVDGVAMLMDRRGRWHIAPDAVTTKVRALEATQVHGEQTLVVHTGPNLTVRAELTRESRAELQAWRERLVAAAVRADRPARQAHRAARAEADRLNPAPGTIVVRLGGRA